MELLQLLLATGKEECDEGHKKQITEMIREKLEKLGAPQITESQIAEFVGEMRELGECKVRSEAEKKG